jgi:hypothetical protein
MLKRLSATRRKECEEKQQKNPRSVEPASDPECYKLGPHSFTNFTVVYSTDDSGKRSKIWRKPSKNIPDELHKDVEFLIKQANKVSDKTDIYWWDYDNFPDDCILTLENVRNVRDNGTILYVIPPQDYSEVLKLTAKNFMFSDTNDTVSHVGYFFKDDKDGDDSSTPAVSGSGSDIWILVTPKLREYLKAFITKKKWRTLSKNGRLSAAAYYAKFGHTSLGNRCDVRNDGTLKCLLKRKDGIVHWATRPKKVTDHTLKCGDWSELCNV